MVAHIFPDGKIARPHLGIFALRSTANKNMPAVGTNAKKEVVLVPLWSGIFCSPPLAKFHDSDLPVFAAAKNMAPPGASAQKSKAICFFGLVPIKELNWNGSLRNMRKIKDLLELVLPEAGLHTKIFGVGVKPNLRACLPVEASA